MSGFNWVLNRTVAQLYLDHIAARSFHSFLDGNRHFACLATAKADFTFTITDNCQSGEAKYTATLYYFSDTVNLNQLLLEVTILLLLFLIIKSHISTLEVQSSFTSRIGQSLNTSVVLVSTAIESDFLYTRLLRSLSNQLTNRCRSIDIASLAAAQVSLQSRSTGQYRITSRRYHLGINMPRSTVHTQAINALITHTGAGPTGATQP